MAGQKEGRPMNSRFVPGAAPAPTAVTQASPRSAALVTPSFRLDLERCRLLCETVDARVSGMAHHYLLVEGRDVKPFRQFQSARRTVVDERDLLPRWLRAIDDPTSLFRRRIWLSLRTRPLRGWHVQQLRRIAIAAHVAQDDLVYCDSDVAFLKPFDLSRFVDGGRTRLFRRDGALLGEGHALHKVWSAHAGEALGIGQPTVSPHDYISTLIAWRRETINAMCAHMEATHSRHWIEVIGSSRRFSECMIYGRYVDEVLSGAGHFLGHEEFCRVHWTGTPMDGAAFATFVEGMGPEQAAIGMQSFIGTDIERIRRLVLPA